MAFVYISIPDGYWFQAGSVEKKTSDCFINIEGQVLPLQSIVKLALQRRPSHAECYSDKNISVYYKYTPQSGAYFLRYFHKNNGKYPSEIEPEKVIGLEHCKYAHRITTKYGESWMKDCFHFFSSDRQYKIKEHRRERRDNLRKTGDSPAAN